MIRVFASAAAAALMSTAAFAADLPVYEPAPVIAPVPVGFTWNGPYVGAFAGYGWADVQVKDIDDFNSGGAGRTFDYDTDGFYGGAMAGYNFQWNWLVVGVEGEIAYLDLDDEEQDPLIAEIGVGREDDSIASIETDLYAALTARVGIGFDRVLVYARGGVAFVDAEASFEDDNIAGTILESESDDDWLTGYTIGGGVEVAVTQNVTLRGEYMFTDFSEELTSTGTDTLDREFEFEQELEDVHLVKVGVAYKF